MDNERRFADALPGLVWTADGDGSVNFVNRRWSEYTGLSLQVTSETGWQSPVHPDDLAAARERFRAALSAGEPGEMKLRLRRHDGTYRRFLIAWNPERDDAGHIVRWCGLNTDFEDRPEPDLASIIDTIPIAAWVTAPDGYCEYLNQVWRDYSGLTLEAARGWGWASAIHPDDIARMVEHWKSCLETGSTAPFEARMRRFDGVYRWVLFMGSPLRDAAGNIVRWYGANVDIEDRRHAEEALREREREVSLVINTIPMLAWSTRPDGFCDYLNQQWLDYTGLTIEEGGGWSWGIAMHPDDVKGLAEIWRGALAKGMPVETEARIRRHDGVYRWFGFHANPLRDATGKIVRWYGANVDIEDRRRADEALAKVRSDLSYMTRVASMGVLTASIAHEVNQPLAGMVTNANACVRMLATNPPDLEGARRTADRMIRDSNRAADVITRLRALFAKRDAAYEPIDLNEATREVVALHANELRRNRVVLRTELDDGLPRIAGDRIQLQQVILNLIINASTAMSAIDDRPRHLVIKTERGKDGSIELSVRDSGVGLGADDPERLFKPFYTTKIDGMGIGLSVSRTILENHKGRLWASTNDGPGATFTFSIPPASA